MREMLKHTSHRSSEQTHSSTLHAKKIEINELKLFSMKHRKMYIEFTGTLIKRTQNGDKRPKRKKKKKKKVEVMHLPMHNIN